MKQIKPPRALAYLATLKPRERVLLGACALVFFYVVLEVLIVRPQRAETKRLQQVIERNNTEAVALVKSLEVVRSTAAPDQTAQLKVERDKMVEVIQRAETILQSNSGSGSALEGMRALTNAQAGLKLVALKTLPPEPIVLASGSPSSVPQGKAGAAQAAAPAASAPGAPAAPLQIFRSGVEMTLQGSYPTLVAFMTAVQKSAPRLLWGDVNLETIYPESRVKLTLYSIDTRPIGLVE
jgi:hypothetical protein